MTPSDDAEARRLRDALASLVGEEDAREVDAARIFEALHGTTLSDEERRAVVDELAHNPEAAEAWRLARELSPAGQQAGGGTRRLWPVLSIAAAALLAVTLGWQLFDPLRNREEPAYRSVEPRRVESLLPADASLSRSSPVLRWTRIEGARYRLRVLTPELDVLEEVDELTKPEHVVSADALRRIPAGGQLLWQVEASVPGDAKLVSPTFSVRLQ